MFAYKEELKAHKEQEHVQIICNVCNKLFKKEIYLNAHKATAHRGGRGFMCPICDTVFNRKYNMEKHLSGHIADNFCKICCASFITTTALNKHLTKHTKDELYRIDSLVARIACPYCMDKEIFFLSKLALYQHEQAIHAGTDTVTYSCTICMKFFKSESILNTHIRQKHSLTKWSCKECAKEFSSLSNLIHHQRTHTNDRPYPCTLCSKSFRFQSNLLQHTLVHKNERQYKCLYCPMAFFRSNTLQEHLRIHTNEKPYECKFCKKCFRQSNVLQKHVQSMHLTCDKCGTMVGKKTNLLVHFWNKCKSLNELASENEN